jgi:hypothetical protein
MNLSLFMISFAIVLVLIILVLCYNEDIKYVVKIVVFITVFILYISSLLFFNKYKGLTSDKPLIPDYKIEYKIIDGMNKIDTTYYYYIKD